MRNGRFLTILVVLCAVPSAGADAQEPPTEPVTFVAVPADPGVSTDVVIDHSCPSDQAVGRVPSRGDLLFFEPLGQVGEHPVVVDLGVGAEVRLACGSGDVVDEWTNTCILPVGDVSSGVVDIVVDIQCPIFGLFGEAFGDTEFWYGDEPLALPLDVVGVDRTCWGGDVRVVHPSSGSELSDLVDLSELVAAADTEVRTFDLMAFCDFGSDQISDTPACSRVRYDTTGIVGFDDVRCSEIGGAFDVDVQPDGSLLIASPCGPDGAVVDRVVSADLVDETPLGDPGETPVLSSPLFRRFELGCSGSSNAWTPTQCFTVNATLVDPQAVWPYACGSFGELTGDAPVGSVALHLPERPVPPFIGVATQAQCWSDSEPMVSVDGGAPIPTTNFSSVANVLPDRPSITGVELRLQCVADGTTGLPSGPAACAEVAVVETVRSFRSTPCTDPAGESEGRVTLIRVGDRVVVESCASSSRFAVVDAVGTVLAPVPTDTVNGQTVLPLGTDVSTLVARCVLRRLVLDEVVDGPGVDLGLPNCYSSAVRGIPAGHLVDFRPCGFVELHLPENGSGGPATTAVLAAAMVLAGSSLRRIAGRARPSGC